MKKNISSYSFLLFFCFFISISSFGKTIFVNTSVSNGNNDGTSWQNAYTNFQSAINEAIYGDSIWVAQGTYFPTDDTIRDISFELKNGVKWFGGFQGNETELGQRDFNLYPTILSGDIGVVGDSTDNSYHVIISISSDSITILDGFIIEKGQATSLDSTGNNQSFSGGGLLLNASMAEPITKPKIINCIFRENEAKYGGAISYGTGYHNFHINPIILNCKFFDNKAIVQNGVGGAIRVIGGNNNFEEAQSFRNCLFKNNSSNLYGGGVYINETINETIFIDCDFIDNFSQEGGGGLSYRIQFFTNLSNLSFSSCNFLNNKSARGGGLFIGLKNLYAEGVFELMMENSFFHNNTLVGNGFFLGSAIYYDSSVNRAVLNLVNSIFEENSTNEFQTVVQATVSPFVPPFEDNFLFNMLGCKFIDNQSICLGFSEVSFQPCEIFYSVSNTLFKGNKRAAGFGKQDESFLNAKMLNCTFFENETNLLRGNFDSLSVLEIANSIFWEDMTAGEMFNDGVPSGIEGFNIHHSLLKTSDCLINGVDACGDGMIFNIYPEFRDTLNGDLSLRSCSPALNQGDNTVLDSLGILFDIEGTPRIVDSAVDLGAYETQAFEVLVPQVDHVSCTDGMDGSMSWVQHGTPPYIFEWDNGTMMGTELSNLSAGDYNITITDADSCIGFLDLTINEPLQLEVQDTITDASSSLSSDGKIDLMLTGGTPDYEYLWSNGDTTALIGNLLPAIYSVTITDANGCQLVETYEVGFMTNTISAGELSQIKLLPNISQQNIPVNLFFEISEASTFVLSLRNELGQLFFTKKIKRTVGKSWLEIPSPSSSGLYFLEVKNEEGERKVLKWMVF